MSRLTDIFSQSAFEQIQNNNSGKLKSLKDIKDTYTIETYLKLNDIKNRLALPKLRTSNHTLDIETGRWTKTIGESRLYNQCTEHKIEDERHLIFECKNYGDERLSTCNLLNLKQTLIYLLKQIDLKSILRFCILIVRGY